MVSACPQASSYPAWGEAYRLRFAGFGSRTWVRASGVDIRGFGGVGMRFTLGVVIPDRIEFPPSLLSANEFRAASVAGRAKFKSIMPYAAAVDCVIEKFAKH